MPFDPRRNSFTRDGRLRAAAKEIAGRGLRPVNVGPGLAGVAGLGCQCQVQRVKGATLKGYQRALLKGVHRFRGRGLSGAPPAGTPALIPVSDRSAVNAAVRRFAAARSK